MKVVNYTELRLNLKHWLDLVVDDFEELIIKRKNNKDLVLISLEEYRFIKRNPILVVRQKPRSPFRVFRAGQKRQDSRK
jgi:antitoxin YefM